MTLRNAHDIENVLRSRDETTLLQGLTSLRDHLTPKVDEQVSVQDQRLVLLSGWLEADPALESLFTLWERTQPRQHALLSVIVSLLSNAVTLLSSHYTYHATATPVLQKIMSPSWMTRLNSYITSSYNDLVLMTLKLLNSLSLFAAGQQRKALIDNFAWDVKALPKLLNMRRKGTTVTNTKILASPDIRTLFVLFLLSFVDSTSTTVVKSIFLEQHRDIFSSIFKGLAQDPYPVIRKVLEVSWNGIWSDPKLKRSLKISLFNEAIILQLVKLYDRRATEGPDDEDRPADLVHHFLIAICTQPGRGVCFKDRGWYFQEEDGEKLETQENPANRKVYNKILSGVVKALKISEDTKQRDLAIRILKACPELVSGYWSAASLTLEPRLSSTWLANVTFLGSVITQEIPSDSFRSGEEYRPFPPFLAVILDNVLPTAHIKAHMSRGLQSSSPLVQLYTALTLAKCLSKYLDVVGTLASIQKSLEEDDTGQWAKRRTEVEREVRRRVPDLQVVLAFAQKRSEVSRSTPLDPASNSQTAGSVRTALLSESAQRLIWLYHQCFPSFFLETRFDSTKLLHHPSSRVIRGNGVPGLRTIQQIHALRTLSASDSIVLTGKTDGGRSNFLLLLDLYVHSVVPAAKSAVAFLLRQCLSNSIIFQHDPDEVALWLSALPMANVKTNTDEDRPFLGTDVVLPFLEECVLRCMKTPFKYIEDMKNVYSVVGDESLLHATDGSYSPLLVTVVEQISAKAKGRQWKDTEFLAVLTYTRQLLARLAGKIPDLGLLRHISAQIQDVVQTVVSSGNQISEAIFREVHLMALLLRQDSRAVRVQVKATSEHATVFDSMLATLSGEAHGSAVSGLFRQVHLLDSITNAELNELAAHVRRYHPAALPGLFEYSTSVRRALWNCTNLLELPAFNHALDLAMLLIYSDDTIFEDTASREKILNLVNWSSMDCAAFKRAIRSLHHRMQAVSLERIPGTISNTLLLLGETLSRARDVLSGEDLRSVKQFTFQLPRIKEYASQSLPEICLKSFSSFMEKAVDIKTSEDLHLIASYTTYWASIAQSPQTATSFQTATASVWIQFMGIHTLFGVFDALSTTVLGHGNTSLLMETIQALAKMNDASNRNLFASRIPALVALYKALPNCRELESVLASAIQSSLPPGYDGMAHLSDTSRTTIHDIVSEFASFKPASDLPFRDEEWDLTQIINSTSWTDSTVSIVVAAIYFQASARDRVLASQNLLTGLSVSQLAPLVYAILDSSRILELPNLDDRLLPSLSRLSSVCVTGQSSLITLNYCVEAISIAVQRYSGGRAALLKAFREACIDAGDSINNYMLSIAQVFASHFPDATSVVNILLERSWKWLTVTLDEGGSLDDTVYIFVDTLEHLLSSVSSMTYGQTEDVAVVASSKYLHDPRIVRFVRRLIDAKGYKPATVNKIIQTIVQHPKFTPLCDPSNTETNPARDAIVNLLYTLFNTFPTNTCQPSHVSPLASIYSGTLSVADRRLLSIFRLYEVTRKVSIAPLLTSGLAGSSVGSQNPQLDLILRLDPGRIFRTVVDFPQWRSLLEDIHSEVSQDDTNCYDPTYILLLVAQFLIGTPPSTALTWVQFFRSNAVSLLIRALSSHDTGMRKAAHAHLTGLYIMLQAADMAEKKHVIMIFDLLRDQIDDHCGNEGARIPAHTTLHLAHALRCVFYPSHFTYPLTARHLLQRPSLDLDDVPMLYTMLFSTDDQWRAEHLWILRFLTDGLVGKREWDILTRRHTWDLLASQYQGQQDRAARRYILEFLANLTCLSSATDHLVTKCALLEWIEDQLRTVPAEEVIAWLMILENIIVTLRIRTPMSPTALSKYNTLGRCVLALLRAGNGGTLLQALRLLLRLVEVNIECPILSDAITEALAQLQSMEPALQMHELGEGQPSSKADTRPPPHTSRTIWYVSQENPISTWGKGIEVLWQVALKMNKKCSTWTSLLLRILIWRAVVGKKSCAVGEWTREQVVRTICT
ncbi:hypothetical protein K474DRAFT_1664265 [Panus rudis PR-1116 ss-1]|nr:hypothetical protein K474DRAFT_1664265 [Panus rudis PR-1116 ss-1]